MSFLFVRFLGPGNQYTRQLVKFPSNSTEMYTFLDSLEQILPPTKESAVPLKFTGARKWQEAFDHDSRVTCARDLDPQMDFTIVKVLKQRDWWVGELLQAMLNLCNIRDPHGPEVRLFTPGHKHYDERNIEAKCWLLFGILIDQVTNGYRGSRSQSLAKTKRDDRHVNAEQRIQNVVQALKFDKRVCKDVLQDPTRINDLVYAPLAVADRKLVNEKNNTTKKEAIMQLKQKASVDTGEKEDQEPTKITDLQAPALRKGSFNILQLIKGEPSSPKLDTMLAGTDSDLDGEYELDSDYAGNDPPIGNDSLIDNGPFVDNDPFIDNDTLIEDNPLTMFNKFAHPDPSSMFTVRKPATERIFAPQTHGTKRSLQQLEASNGALAATFPRAEQEPGLNVLERRYREHLQRQTERSEDRQQKKQRRTHDG
ncbi:hypothetical protein BDV96DRAFT_594311 [Lophiotrema nucula]|uniref:Uncharacterized protein n=1 Tax=Lophiotrema nucula TaxID=690887 RepID=A0A6A5ZNQ2_9PLEO|nr:hypothetical protein BDV96DRAFT_594311 [Lophiotrema nucula]